MATSSAALEQRYLLEWQNERRKVRLVGRLCTVATLLIIGTLFFFLIYLGNPAIELIALSFFVIFTNFSRFVIYRLYLVPRFFFALRSADEEERAAAWRVIDAHRQEMLHPIVVERREHSRPEDIAALSPDVVAGWDSLDKVAWWERFARGWLIAWVLVLCVLLGMLYGLFQDVMYVL